MREIANVNNNKRLLLSLTNMKRITFFLCLFTMLLQAISMDSLAQTTPDALAYYPGDFDALNVFLRKEIVYPKNELKKGISGTVYVQFIVDSLGNTVNHQIHRGASPGLDEEALRVAKLIKGFVPAKSGGKPISSDFILPIKFVAQGETTDQKKSKKSKK